MVITEVEIKMKILSKDISNQNSKVAFKAKISAPKYFWKEIKNIGKVDGGSTASELTRILIKPNSENQIIRINYRKGFFVAKLSKEVILKEQVVNCRCFLKSLANKFAPEEDITKVIDKVKYTN